MAIILDDKKCYNLQEQVGANKHNIEVLRKAVEEGAVSPITPEKIMDNTEDTDTVIRSISNETGKVGFHAIGGGGGGGTPVVVNAVQGTLTEEQLATLKESNDNYISLIGGVADWHFQMEQEGFRLYTMIMGYENDPQIATIKVDNSTGEYTIKYEKVNDKYYEHNLCVYATSVGFKFKEVDSEFIQTENGKVVITFKIINKKSTALTKDEIKTYFTDTVTTNSRLLVGGYLRTSTYSMYSSFNLLKVVNEYWSGQGTDTIFSVEEGHAIINGGHDYDKYGDFHINLNSFFSICYVTDSPNEIK